MLPSRLISNANAVGHNLQRASNSTRKRSNGGCGRRVVDNRSVVADSKLHGGLAVSLDLSVEEAEGQLLVFVGAFGRSSLRSHAGSSLGDSVTERVVVFNSAVDRVRVLAAGQTKVGVVELGDGHNVHESMHKLSESS